MFLSGAFTLLVWHYDELVRAAQAVVHLKRREKLLCANGPTHLNGLAKAFPICKALVDGAVVKALDEEIEGYRGVYR